MTCSRNRFVLTVVSTTLLAMVSNVQAFTLSPLTQLNTRSTTAHCTQIHAQKDNRPMEMENMKKGMASLLVASTICLSTLSINSPAATAYDDYSYSDMNDVDTVEKVVKSLKDASGDAAASFKAFESINEIITEGKGVGGMISSCKFFFTYPILIKMKSWIKRAGFFKHGRHTAGIAFISFLSITCKYPPDFTHQLYLDELNPILSSRSKT